MHNRTRRERYELLRRHSDDPNAYAALQPDLDYFDGAGGFVAYRRALGAPVVLGDPVAAPGHLRELLGAFVAQEPAATFVNITEPLGHLLDEVGAGRYRFVPFASEKLVDVEVAAETMAKPVRGAMKKGRRGGLRLEEVDLDALSASRRRRVAAIDARFLARSTAGRELDFIARALELRSEPGVRAFLMHHSDRGDERLFGVCTLDPFFSGGRLVGAQLHQIRFDRTRIWGVYLCVAQRLAALLADEGLDFLSLGGCAFHRAGEPHRLPAAPLYEAARMLASERADRFHSMSNFTAMKLLFPGPTIRRYIAGPSTNPLLPLLRFLRASRIIWWPGDELRLLSPARPPQGANR
jgi:lysylphosphatidylglycerol synthetase-like protein (DUF2156 family)